MRVDIRRVDLDALDPTTRRHILHRSAVADPAVRRVAAEICDAVATDGDAALRRFGQEHGGGRDTPLVSQEEMADAWSSLAPVTTEALEIAAANVRTVHEAQRPADITIEPVDGVRIDRIWSPLRSVGAYVPGGTAAYPSSLIMTTVPALAAGVGRIVVASPSGPGGEMDQTLLGAAHMLGITELYAMGGAQAVAAMAYGTETIDRVDKIVGPGNAYVTAAKLHVLGECAIDMPAGPSEVLVIADHTAEPRMVAVDMLCQAEHGPDSPAVLVTVDESLGDRVVAELDSLLPSLERREILARALTDHALIVSAPTLDDAVAFADEYAAEHVSVLTEDAAGTAAGIRSAGSIYVGHWSPESAGDYATGANHVLPTGGLARSVDPLGLADFGSWRQVQTITESGLREIGPTICALATAEGLTAHRLSAEIRLGSS